jgi:hypothetical protein
MWGVVEVAKCRLLLINFFSFNLAFGFSGCTMSNDGLINE